MNPLGNELADSAFGRMSHDAFLQFGCHPGEMEFNLDIYVQFNLVL